MINFGKTWWGEKWLQAFQGIDFDNRLPRGRRYAKNGMVEKVEFKRNEITARVKGSYYDYYTIKIWPQIFTKEENKIIADTISNSKSMITSLLNKELPTELYQKLEDQGIRLFPTDWHELDADCSCPDYAMPCKHIAAVIYLIASEIDKNPFMIFNLHGCDLIQLLDEFKVEKKDSVATLKVDDLFTPFKGKINQKESLNELFFQKLDNLLETITGLLKPNPSFYDLDFLETLKTMYQSYSRILINEPLSEEVFLEKWKNIRDVNDNFQLVLNNNLSLSVIIGLKPARILNCNQLIELLTDIPPSLWYRYPILHLLALVYHFSQQLVINSAIIPQILEHNGKYLIRYIPALFNDKVKENFEQITDYLPVELLTYKNITTQPSEQLKWIISFFVTRLTSNKIPSKFMAQSSRDVFRLFFSQGLFEFTSFGKQGTGNAIASWLAPLHFTSRDYNLYLTVSEKEAEFGLVIEIASKKGQSVPTPLPIYLKKLSSNKRLEVLADLSMITNLIRPLNSFLDNYSPVYFHLDAFSDIFFRILPILKKIGILVVLPKNLQKMFVPKLSLNLSSKNTVKTFLNLNQLLSFNWQISIGDTKVSISQFKELIKNTRGLVKLADYYMVLDDAEIEKLLNQIENIPDKLSNIELMQAALAKQYGYANVNIDANLEKLFKQLEDHSLVSVPNELNAILRPYQIRGYNWLLQNIKFGFGSILADDMGLGKTLQVIGLILYLKLNKYLSSKKVLIVVPTTLLSNWQKEFTKFAPLINVHIFHGNNRELPKKYDVLLTSYGLIRRQLDLFSTLKTFLLVIDEAQNIKNPTTGQSKAIKSIDSMHKIALTGTPVENRLLDYWSIFDFTNTNYLGSPKKFKDNFAIPIERDRNKDVLTKFNQITRPFILRRLKSDKSIIKDLPNIIENNRYCNLTKEQASIYQSIVNLTLEKLDKLKDNKDAKMQRKGLILKLITSLKQVCNHPIQYTKKGKASIEQSGKFQILLEILKEISEHSEKTLIFTQYVEMGDLMIDLLKKELHEEVSFLHGGLTRKYRDEMVNQFQNDAKQKILILSLKAGGTGLNLTAASHVIHYDLWWNPAVEKQATDRAYRIGQKNNVMVYRLLTTGTFEERINEMLYSKKELADLTVGTGGKFITELKTNELKELISLRQEFSN